LLEAVGLGADKVDDGGVMGQAIQQGSREGGVAEHLHPVAELEIGGDDESQARVQAGAELEQQLRPVGREGDEAQLIQDDELVSARLGDEALDLVLILSRQQVVDQGGGVVEADAMALTTSTHGQRRGDVCFSNARLADQC
jgi:hypothetical protein